MVCACCCAMHFEAGQTMMMMLEQVQSPRMARRCLCGKPCSCTWTLYGVDWQSFAASPRPRKARRRGHRIDHRRSRPQHRWGRRCSSSCDNERDRQRREFVHQDDLIRLRDRDPQRSHARRQQRSRSRSRSLRCEWPTRAHRVTGSSHRPANHRHHERRRSCHTRHASRQRARHEFRCRPFHSTHQEEEHSRRSTLVAAAA